MVTAIPSAFVACESDVDVHEARPLVERWSWKSAANNGQETIALAFEDAILNCGRGSVE